MTNQVNQDVIKPIEYDHEMDRFYIPVNSRYEIQTKGKGSSFRIANTSTHLRSIVLNDSLHPVLEDMAKATNAEMRQLQAATQASESEINLLKQRVEELETENTIMRETLNKIALGYVYDADIIESAGDCLQRLCTKKSLAEHDNEVTAPYKKALEFAEYMAKSTEQFMIAINHLDEADREEDEETVEILQEKRGEHWRAVNCSIYEFRQRSDRALKATP